MSGLTLGSLGAEATVSEDRLARTTRLCHEAAARGEPGSQWCVELARLHSQIAAGSSPYAPGSSSTVTPEEAARIREAQARERRGGIARGMTNVGLNPTLVQAARDTKDVQYVGPVYGPAQPTAAEWAAMPPLPPAADHGTQHVVAQTNLRNQQAQTRPGSSLSAHAQAAKIRNQWAATRQPVPSYPQPMTGPRQNQLILATRAQQGGLGTGAKIAAASLAAVAVLSLGALLFSRR